MKSTYDVLKRIAERAAAADVLSSAAVNMFTEGLERAEARARIGGKNLTKAATDTVLLSAMSLLALLADAGEHKSQTLSIMRQLYAAIPDMHGQTTPRHRPHVRPDLPGEWVGKPNGPWITSAEGGRAMILAYDPGMPSGDWTVLVKGYPLFYGREPNEVFQKTIRILQKIHKSPSF